MKRFVTGSVLLCLMGVLPVLAANTPELPPYPPEISGGAEAVMLARQAPYDPTAPVDDPLAPVFPGAGFDAFDFDDNGAVNGGFLFIPPDPIGAAGIDRLIAVVNAGLECRDKTGVLLYRSSLQNFFAGAPGAGVLGTFCFDPKIVYDYHEDRFVVVALERWNAASGDPSDESRILVAVSHGPSPATATGADWNFYSINSKLTIGAGDTWADYPGLEVDEEAVYITSNFFPFTGSGGSFGERLYIIDKGVAGGFYAGGPVAWNIHDPYTAAGFGGFETTTMPCEVIQPGGVGPGIGTFLVSYNGLTFGGVGQPEAILVIRVDNPLGVTTFTGEFVTIGDIEDIGGVIGWPALPDAPQSGGTALIEVNDRRALDAVWRNGFVYLTTTINPNALYPDFGQTTAHWIRLNATAVINSGSPSGLIALDQEGNIGGDDIAPETYTFFPAIAVNSADEMQVGFSASASQIFAGAYVAGRVPADPPGTVGPSGVVRQGIDYYYRAFGGPRNRWGDYSGMSLDPTDDSKFWVYNEWADLRGTPISGEDGRWGTAWLESSFAAALPPDLIVSDFDGPCCVYHGEQIGAYMLVEVANIGPGPSTACQLGLYLSPTPVITVADPGLIGGTLPVPALPPGGIVVLAVPPGIIVPPVLPPGAHFLGAIVDQTNIVAEVDETNNTAAKKAEVNLNKFGCMRAHAYAGLVGEVSLFMVPDGSGDVLTAAQQFTGVGLTPAPIDATINLAATDIHGNPVVNEMFSLSSTLGNLVLCTTATAVDGPTNAAGMATYSGPIFGGGYTDVANDEQIEVISLGGDPLPGIVYGTIEMLGSDSIGNLYRVDRFSGNAAPLCLLDPAGITEIEYNPLTGAGILMEPAGSNLMLEFDWMSCGITGGPYPTPGMTFNGLEWIGNMLYGTGISISCGPSDLFFMDPPSGGYVPIGPTGWGPITGLAWDPVCRTLFGVTGCHTTYGTSKLLVINPNTGASTLVGDTGVVLGSLEMGPGGRLFGGGSPAFGPDLFSIDRKTGVATPIGPTTMPAAVTGLALVTDRAIPLLFNSADISGDFYVNLTDVGFFAAYLSNGVYDYAIDFVFDRVENLSDAGRMVGAIGATCPPKKAVEVAAVQPEQATFSLDLAGVDAQGLLALEAGEEGVALLRVSGEAVVQGLRAWEARIEASENVVIDGIDLAEGSLDLGSEGNFVIGFGTPQSRENGVVELATVRFHVKDATPAALSIVPTTRSSVGGSGPAVQADELVAAAVKSYQGGAAAVINEVPGQDVPATLALDLRTIPNPFNPSTEIHFNLPRTGQVEMRIYDLRGRLVWNATPSQMPAGAQSVIWRGVDQRGSTVTSGVYFYQLVLDGQKLGSPGKMTLLK